MGFDRRKMEDQRREAAEKEAASRGATDAQVLEAAERLIAAWNERQEKRMPMLFSPTPIDQRNRLADSRSSPRRGGDQPYSGGQHNDNRPNSKALFFELPHHRARFASPKLRSEQS
jgi:hypothetical protein